MDRFAPIVSDVIFTTSPLFDGRVKAGIIEVKLVVNARPA
jgi:hypothetical protein